MRAKKGEAMMQTNLPLSRRSFIAASAVLAAAAACVPSIAYADPTSAEKMAEADEVRSRVSAMNSDLERLAEEYYAALDEHDAAVIARDEAQGRIDEASSHIRQLQEKLGTRATSMYRTGNSSMLDMLLGATTFEQFVTNWSLLTKMNKQDALLINQTKELRQQIEVEEQEFANQERIASEKAEQARTTKEQAEVTVSALQAELDSLDEEARQLLLKEEEEAAAALRAAEAERLAREQEEAERQAREQAAQNQPQQTVSDPEPSTGNNDPEPNPSTPEEPETPSDPGNSWTEPDPEPEPDPTPSMPAPPANGSVVAYAEYCLGTPYVWGGNTPGVGLDCSGLTYWCYQQVGITIPRTTYGMKDAASWVGAVSEAQPGDILWSYGHVGICTEAGGGTYIHAPTFGQVVSYSSWPQFSYALRF